TLFKIIALGCAIFFMGFSLLMGVLAFFGAHTVHWNRESVTGLAGLMLSPFLGAMLALGFTLFGWIAFAVSFWIYSKFGSLRLDYVSDEAPGTPPNEALQPTAATPGASTAS